MRSSVQLRKAKFILWWVIVPILVAVGIAIAVRQDAHAAEPLKPCEGNMKFQKQDDGVLTLKCLATSDWLLFHGSATDGGYRIRWTARTSDYPYRGVIAAGPRFRSPVIPETAPIATASMAKDAAWPLEIRAEPKGSPNSSLTLVIQFGSLDNKDDRRKVIVGSG